MDFHEAVLYSDDSLCIRYRDGSVIQLSPCSSSFRYYQKDISSLKRPHVQQLSRFAVSSYRNQVVAAISLRNQFACCPYLCKDLLKEDSIIVSYKEIKECTWPKTALPEFVMSGIDGSIVVKSLDGYASLKLSSHKKTFTVRYLAEVNPESTDSAQQQPAKIQMKQHFYTWVQKGEHSTDDCQQHWLYPLRMALSVGGGVKTTGEELSKMTNVSELPRSLTVTCSALHTHKWMLKEVFSGRENEDVFWQPNLKVIWKNKVSYQVYRGKAMLKIEIHPDDGSVIFSSNFTGRYFTRCTGGTEDKMYSVDQLPPNKPGMTYSISKLIRQGARLFEFLLQVALHSNSQRTSPCCWESKIMDVQESVPPEITPLKISEMANIPNVGRFVAYSNGHLHIAFADRTIINVRYPKCDLESSHQRAPLERSLIFSVILPNGQVAYVSGQDMHGLERYIRLACEWGDWFNSSPQQRQSFYQDKLSYHEQRRIVETEMSKLRRFNYILNNGPLTQTLMKANQSHPAQTDADHHEIKEELHAPVIHDMLSANSALKKTTEAIKDIETFLDSNAIKKAI